MSKHQPKLSAKMNWFRLSSLLLLRITAGGHADQVPMKNKELLKYFHNPEAKFSLNNFQTSSQRIAAHGYPVEDHNITTQDGYIITVFRIPYSHKFNKSNEKRPIVLLQHGLFGSSDSWLLLGPHNGLPYMLADAGFDVWLGNSRGNVYGRKHTNVSAYTNNFWRFSWHEIGYYDLPAIIDYALARSQTNQHNSLHYIGFSQGTTASLVMLTTRPAFNEKIKMAHLLAPVAYVRHLDDKLVCTLAPWLGRPSTSVANLFTGQEFLPQNKLFIKLSYNICNSTALTMSSLCSGIAFLLEGDQNNMNQTALQLLSETHPAGCSSNQIIHYMQEQQSGRFCAFDFGSKQNYIHYTQKQAPDYELKNIKVPLHLWYSDNDKMSTLEDVTRLSKAIQSRTLHHLPDPKWAHGHFLLSAALKQQIHEPLINIIKEYEDNYS